MTPWCAMVLDMETAVGTDFALRLSMTLGWEKGVPSHYRHCHDFRLQVEIRRALLRFAKHMQACTNFIKIKIEEFEKRIFLNRENSIWNKIFEKKKLHSFGSLILQYIHCYKLTCWQFFVCRNKITYRINWNNLVTNF